MTETLNLPIGYYELPKGKLVNVVTCLEMTAKPEALSLGLPEGLSLRRFGPENIIEFRDLFRVIGTDLMWFSRLIMPDQQLLAILTNPATESFALVKDDEPIGLLELNFAHLPDCELAFFGLKPDAVGHGLGRALMTEAIRLAWMKPISRFWVHTCHYDHPKAVSFYKSSGFKPYSLMIEVHDDPRLSGHLPESASPQVALLK